MPDINNSEEQTHLETGRGAFRGLEHGGYDEVLHMNKYHLLWVIERLQQKPKGPQIEHVLIPLVLLLGTLLTLLPADFQDYFGVKAVTWEAITSIIVWLSAISTVVLFVWWLVCKIKFGKKSPLEIVDEIIGQMEDDRKKVASMGHDDKETKE